MPSVRELITTWGFDINDAPLKSMERSVNGVKHLVQAVFFGETTKKIWEFISTTAEAGHEAALTAQKIGVNAQALMGLQHAAYMSDVANEELTSGLKFLSRHMFDASKGSSEAIRNFQILGIKTKDAKGHLLGADNVLGQIADKFEAMPDGAKKTALAVELFGRGGIAMIPMLSKGSKELANMTAEARQFGLVMDDKALKQSELFMDSLKRLKMSMVGIKREVGLTLIPLITQYIQKLIQWFKANHAIIRQNIGQFFKELIRIIKDVWHVVDFATRMINGLVKALGGTASAIQVVMRVLEAGAVLKIIMTIVAAIGIMPAEIIAAIGLIYLIVDDLIGYFHGKKSVFGVLIEYMKKAFEEFKKTSAFKFLAEQLEEIIGLTNDLQGMWIDICNNISQAVRDIKSLFKGGYVPGIASMVRGASVGAASSMFGIGNAAPAPAAAGAGGGGWTNTMQYAPNITLNFEGLGGDNNPHAIRNIVKDALKSEWRQAIKDFPRVVER